MNLIDHFMLIGDSCSMVDNIVGGKDQNGAEVREPEVGQENSIV